MEAGAKGEGVWTLHQDGHSPLGPGTFAHGTAVGKVAHGSGIRALPLSSLAKLGLHASVQTDDLFGMGFWYQDKPCLLFEKQSS